MEATAINKLVLPIKVRKDDTRNLMKSFVKIMSIVYKTQPRENELLMLMMIEFDKAYKVTKNVDLSYEIVNSTKIRRVITEQLGLSLAVYRTMLNKLRNNYVLKKDNRFPNMIETFLRTYSNFPKFEIEFLIDYGS